MMDRYSVSISAFISILERANIYTRPRIRQGSMMNLIDYR